jgi:uncharacterized membrane protein YeaQ/YmgE (transglycosylase-associated protein family)
MSILAWVVLGLIVGVVAEHLVNGRDEHGIVVSCVIGIIGALVGGWLATKIFHVVSLQGFFNLSTWITALIGSVLLLGAFRLVEGRGSYRR